MQGSNTIGSIVCFPTEREWREIYLAGNWFRKLVRLPDYHPGFRIELQFHDCEDDSGDDASEAATLMRWAVFQGHKIYGPYAQRFKVGNPCLTVTFIHELCHLVDRFNQGSEPGQAKPASSNYTLFEPLWAAYALTSSALGLHLAAHGEWVLREIIVKRSDGSVEEAKLRGEDGEPIPHAAQGEAIMMLKTHEVFARCLSAYILYNLEEHCEGEQSFAKKHAPLLEAWNSRLRGRAALYGADLTRQDYEMVKAPLTAILEGLGWAAERGI